MTTVLVLAGSDVEGPVLEALDPAGLTVRRCLDAVDLLARVQADEADAAIIEAPRHDLDLDALAALERHHTSAIAVASTSEGRAWAETLGFADVVDTAQIRSLPSVVADATARRPAPDPGPPPQPPGRLIAVWGPLGAPGRSTVAVNLAAELARRDHERVLLIDADPFGASLAQHLGLLDDVSGLLSAARAAGQGQSFDTGGLGEFTATVQPGFGVLTGLPRADAWRHVRPRAWQRILDTALAGHSTVVVDTGFCIEPPDDPTRAAHHRHHLALDALARAGTILAVSTADPIGLARLVRGLDDVDALGVDADLRVVVNQHDPTTGWRTRDVEDTLVALAARRPAAILPYDKTTAWGALAAARTLAEHHPDGALTRSVASLARAL